MLTRNSTELGPLQEAQLLSLDPVTGRFKETFQLILFCILCGMVSLFGTGANIVNMVVFIRQGFKDSINITLLGLAVADLGCDFTIFWQTICFSPACLQTNLPLNPVDVAYVTVCWPHVYFNRVTSLITAFITIERCLCVTVPLKVKTIITHSRTKIIIITIFSATLILLSPNYYVNQLQWRFNPSKNRTILTLVFAEHRVLIEAITLPFYSLGMSSISLIVVAVCTVILAVKLKQKAKWRQLSVKQEASSIQNMSSRDTKVLKMITVISLIFIICFTPATVNFFIMAFVPEFSMTGQYGNLFLVVWFATMFLEAINSSVNIFIYLNMSSKFRGEFAQLFCWHSNEEK